MDDPQTNTTDAEIRDALSAILKTVETIKGWITFIGWIVLLGVILGACTTLLGINRLFP